MGIEGGLCFDRAWEQTLLSNRTDTVLVHCYASSMCSSAVALMSSGDARFPSTLDVMGDMADLQARMRGLEEQNLHARIATLEADATDAIVSNCQQLAELNDFAA